MNKLLIILAAFSLSCSTEAPTTESKEETQPSTDIEVTESTPNAEEAERWLRDAIADYFGQELNDLKTITTPTYASYKLDMIGAEYDGGMDFVSLQEKWGEKYSFTEGDIGVGFLIGAQDYHEIKIKSIEALPNKTDSGFLFKIVLMDTGYDTSSESVVTVIPFKDSYAINNVKEYYK